MRKAILRTVAQSCAVKVQGEEKRRNAKATILRVWRAHKARKQAVMLMMQSTRDGYLARADSKLSLGDSSREDEDIWLSL
jgi:hypothetical protein